MAQGPYSSEFFNTKIGDVGSYAVKNFGSHFANFRGWYFQTYFRAGRAAPLWHVFMGASGICYVAYSASRRRFVGPDGEHVLHGVPGFHPHGDEEFC
jgi:hypothetical protein